jgi:glycosyltransferase involved in cell wall biosynthesis
MITILHITPAYKPAYFYGGPTLSVSKLCEELQKTKVQVKVLTTTANGTTELPVSTNILNKVAQVDVYYFKRLTKDHTHFSPTLIIHLIKMIRENKKLNPGELIVHIHSWWNTIAIFSCLVALLYKIPVVLSPRGMVTPYTLNNRNYFYKKLIHKLLGKHLLKHCFIHATSEKEKRDISQVTRSIKGVGIIPNLVKYPAFNHPGQSANRGAQALKLLFLSRIEEKKGLELLMVALYELKMHWQLTIAGQGEAQYIQHLKNICTQLKIERKITWIGEVNNAEKFEVYQNNDLLILPSHNENFGNVVIESLSVGTPVILSTEVGLAPYVLKNNLGWVTELHAQKMAQVLSQAAGEYGKRAWIRKEGPKIIRKDYTEKALVTKYIAMYHHILNNDN